MDIFKMLFLHDIVSIAGLRFETGSSSTTFKENPLKVCQNPPCSNVRDRMIFAII